MQKIRIAIITVSLIMMTTACGAVDAGGAAASGPPTDLPTARYVALEPFTTAPPAITEIAEIDIDVLTPTATPAAKTASPKTAEPEEPVSAPAFAATKPAAAPQPAPSSISAEAAKFMVKASKYYGSHGFSSNHYKYSAAEMKMLAIVIHMEARGESYKAKLAVANVVMNRVLSPGYPGNTIKEVVTRPNQFCYKASVTPTAECMRAARDVLDHEAWVVPQNTYFFRSTRGKSNWGRHEYWGHIGNTAFYQDRYSGRYNGDTVPAKLFERTYKWPQYGCKPAARVRKIQTMLKSLGYKVTTDGYFGLDTKSAIVKFQSANRLTADGIAGPATIRALIKKYGLSKYLKL